MPLPQDSILSIAGKLQKRAQHWPKLNRTIGAELNNLTASLQLLKSAMNSTEKQVNEAKAEAAETREVVKMASIERQSLDVIEQLEKGKIKVG